MDGCIRLVYYPSQSLLTEEPGAPRLRLIDNELAKDPGRKRSL